MRNFLMLGSSEPLDPLRFATSWILPPSVLFFLRSIFSFYIFVSIFTIIGIDGPRAQKHYMSYFTSLTFFGLGFYSFFAAMHSGSYWLTGKPLLARWPKALQVMHFILYSTITTFPYLVTIVYWGVIYDYFNSDFAVYSNVSQHILNTIFAAFELIIPRTSPTPWIHLPILVVILALYLGLAYVTYDAQHFYVYDFLDDRIYSRGAITGYCFAILAVTVVAFVIVHYLIMLREWFTEKKLGRTGVFTHRERRMGTETPADPEIGEAEAK